MTYARKFPTSFRIQKGAYHDLHTGNAGPDKPGAGGDGVPDGQAPQEEAQGAAGAEKEGGGRGMRLNELLGLMDADEKVQLIYPDGEKLTGTAGRLFQLLGEAEVVSIGTEPFRVWILE